MFVDSFITFTPLFKGDRSISIVQPLYVLMGICVTVTSLTAAGIWMYRKRFSRTKTCMDKPRRYLVPTSSRLRSKEFLPSGRRTCDTDASEVWFLLLSIYYSRTNAQKRKVLIDI